MSDDRSHDRHPHGSPERHGGTDKEEVGHSSTEILPYERPERLDESISVTLEGDSSGKRPPVDPDA